MKLRHSLLALLFTLAACGQPEETVANRYERTSGEIENMARQLDAETENQVRAVEAGVQNQIDAIANRQANVATPAEANAAAPPPAANAEPATRARR